MEEIKEEPQNRVQKASIGKKSEPKTGGAEPLEQVPVLPFRCLADALKGSRGPF